MYIDLNNSLYSKAKSFKHHENIETHLTNLVHYQRIFFFLSSPRSPPA